MKPRITGMPVIQITMSRVGLSSKRELGVLTREVARMLKTKNKSIRVLIYKVSKENWGDAGALTFDTK